MADDLKRRASLAALDEVKDRMVIGLGTGSTVSYFIRELGSMVRAGLKITGIPTSLESEHLARDQGIPLCTLREHQVLDLTVDGADEVSRSLDLLKGLGGALVREKIVARASRRVVIVIDESKLVQWLGTRAPVPIEVLPFAVDLLLCHVEQLGGMARIREKNGKRFVSDNGNNIIDWRSEPIEDPPLIEQQLKAMPGVVDSGIFGRTAHRIIVASASGVRKIDRKDEDCR